MRSTTHAPLSSPPAHPILWNVFVRRKDGSSALLGTVRSQHAYPALQQAYALAGTTVGVEVEPAVDDGMSAPRAAA